MATNPSEPKFNKDGSPSRRGHAEGSKASRFATDDGRKRPGRPKGARDDKTDVLAIRDMPVEVVLGDKRRTVSTRFASYLRVRERMLKGDLKAIAWFDQKMMQHEPQSSDPDRTKALLAEDEAILARAFARLGLVDPAANDHDAPKATPGKDAGDEGSTS